MPTACLTFSGATSEEPTGNLDSARSAEVLALMRQFNRERGQTFILATHDAEVGAACDRIIRMRDGLIVGEEWAAGATGADSEDEVAA